MNPDAPKTPREEMEAWLTALLLGELSAGEAAAVRELMKHDAELAGLHERLRQSIALLREAVPRVEPPSPSAEPLRLSEERRKKLLAAFAIPPLKPAAAKPRRQVRFRLIEVLAGLTIVALLAALFLPALSRSKSRSQLALDSSIMPLPRAESARRVEESQSLKFKSWSLDGGAATERAPAATASQNPSNVHSANVVGYINLPLAATNLVSVANRIETREDAAAPVDAVVRLGGDNVRTYGNRQGGLEVERYALERAGTKPAAAEPMAAPAPPVQIVLPTPPPDDVAGVAAQQLFQQNQGVGSAFSLSEPASVGVLEKVGDGASRPAEGANKQWTIGAALRGFSDDAVTKGVSSLGVAAGDKLGEDGRATALRDSFGFEIAHASEPLVLMETTRALPSRNATNNLGFGRFKPDELGRVPESSVPTRAGAFAVTEPTTSERFSRLPAGQGGGGAAGGEIAGRGITTAPSGPAEMAPVLGELPVLGKLFRSESVTEERLDRNGAKEAVTASAQPGLGNLAYDAPQPAAGGLPATATWSGGALTSKPPAADFGTYDFFAAGSRIQPQQEAVGLELADSSASVPAKPAEVANIVLPSTPAPDVDRLRADRLRVPAQRAAEPAGVDGVAANKAEALVQEGKLILQAGRTGEADKRLSEVQKADAERVPLPIQYPAAALKGTPEDLPFGPNIEPLGETLASRGGALVVAPATPPPVSRQLRQTARKQREVESLRREIGINDTDAAGSAPSPSIEAETIRQLKAAHLQSEVRLSALEAEAAKRKFSTPEKRKELQIAKAEVDRFNTLLNHAESQDAQADQTKRAYYDKKRELEQFYAANGELDEPVVRKASTNAPIPQPEMLTSENNFSTFSLNVSDVSFKLAAASLEKGQMPDAASIRSEEFINAFDYRDPEPAVGAPIAFAWERARYPFAHNRDLLRFSLETAAAGRQTGRPLNIVLLLDNSGSMERADRVRIIREALRVLADQLQPQDKLSVIMFARTPRLVADGISGDKAGEVVEQVSGLTPQGGTNLEEAMNLAYATALKHYLAGGINRIVLLTDGAANLGDVEPESLKNKVETHRRQGIALDAFGIGWEGYNDDLLEVLSRNGDGRYGFINSPEEAVTEFAGQLAGALKVAASDVKVQVEFNPRRVTSYRQIGYAKHQLTKEQFRDNTVDAAEIAAKEAGNALYTVEVNPAGDGPLGTVRVRYKIPGTTDYREQAWDVPFTGNALSLEQSSPAMRLAGSAAAFAEWLVASPFAAEVTPDRVLGVLSGVPEVFGADGRPKKLEWMIRQAKSLEGK